jgi:DNA-directed RNA polymerase subunit beta'
MNVKIFLYIQELLFLLNSFKYKLFTEEQKNTYLVTTVGKIKFNEILPDTFPYLNEPGKENLEGITPTKYFLPMGTDISKAIKDMPLVDAFKKKDLIALIAQVFKRYKTTETSVFLDKLKDLGFKYSTISGISISMSDVITSKTKAQVIKDTQASVDKVNKQFARGLITDEERYKSVCKLWNDATDKVSAELTDLAKKDMKNPILMMMNSGARGNVSQFTQLSGMRGLMAKPNGESIEIPITSNFIEGSNVTEFFLGTHGARKGTADTALRTADSGYLTRRLVDVSQDIIVREEDCGTLAGVEVSDFIGEKEGDVIEPLYDRIVGRFTATKVIDPNTKKS